MAPGKVISVIGSLNIDLVTITPRIPSPGETLTAHSFHTGPGGKGANQAVACSRLSRPKPTSGASEHDSDIVVYMIGAVGQDDYANQLTRSLSESRVQVHGIRTISSVSTGVAVILVDNNGENCILLSPGANYHVTEDLFRTSQGLGPRLPDLIVLQLEIPLRTVQQILRSAKTAGVGVLLNPAPAVKLEDWMYKAITHLILNETEAAILTDRQLEEVEASNFDWSLISSEFLQKGVKNVVITLGARGAFFANAAGQGLVGAVKVKVVDTTAAGDTFIGAYAVSMVRKGKEGLVTASDVEVACKASARTVQKIGAQASIPWEDHIE